MTDISLGDRNAERIKQTGRAHGIDNLHLFRITSATCLTARFGAVDEDDRIAVKGGMLMWYQAETRGDARPTTDIDIHFYEDIAPEEVKDLIRRAVELDAGYGMSLELVSIGDLKHSGDHPGLRAKFIASWGRTKVHFHCDIGFGGRPDPNMKRVRFEPFVKGLPGGSIMMVPFETVYAEKLHAVTIFGSDNTRIKDLHDLAVLGRRGLDPQRLAEAVERTFEDRNTPVPVSGALLAGLTPEFAASRQAQWVGFLRDANRTAAMPAALVDVAEKIAFDASNVFQRVHAMHGLAAGYRPAA